MESLARLDDQIRSASARVAMLGQRQRVSGLDLSKQIAEAETDVAALRERRESTERELHQLLVADGAALRARLDQAADSLMFAADQAARVLRELSADLAAVMETERD